MTADDMPPGVPAVQEAYFPGQVEQFGRILDPVRAAALQAAVQHEAHRMRPPPDEDAIGRVLAAAKIFEAWLASEEGEGS